MILFIIFSILAIIGLVLFLFGVLQICSTSAGDDFCGTVGLILLVLFGLSTLVTGGTALYFNSPTTQANTRVAINEKIASLNSTRAILEKQIDSSTYTVLDVAAYNDQVRNYKTIVQEHQFVLSNPWINWFTCSVYSDYTPDAVSYLYID